MNDEKRDAKESSLTAVALRETEMATRHFEQLAEVNQYYLIHQQSDAQKILNYEQSLTRLERQSIKHRQEHAKTSAELEAAQATIGTLQGTALRKSRSIAKLERQLSVAQTMTDGLTEQLNHERERARILAQSASADKAALQQKLIDEREKHAKAIAELNSQMLTNLSASEQWLRQAIYLLKLAAELMKMRKPFMLGFDARRLHAIQSYCDYSESWCTALSQILGGETVPVASERSHSLTNLLARHDRDFVRSAFLTLLHREPDSDGEAFYLFRLREGVSKLMILGQMRNSNEGRAVDPGIAGLDRAIKRCKLATLPLVGFLFRAIWGGEENGPKDLKIRAYANAIGALRRQNLQMTQEPISAHLGG